MAVLLRLAAGIYHAFVKHILGWTISNNMKQKCEQATWGSVSLQAPKCRW